MRENLDPGLWKRSAPLCGVDEAGRGALAGPVVAAAVIMPEGLILNGVDDSKLLSAARRERLSTQIRQHSLSWAVAAVGQRTIERENIRNASFRAMRRAVARLEVRPGLVAADGWKIPGLELPCEGIVHGDRRSFAIACASIIAKVHRDRLMAGLDRAHPGYGFAHHKGYPTPRHTDALRRLGPSPVHRRTFAPVRRVIQDFAR